MLELTGGVLPPVPRVSWFPDSATILFSAREPGRDPRAFVQDIRGGQPRPVTPEGIWGTLLTADGATLLAYDSRGMALLCSLKDGTSKPLPFLTSEYRPLRFRTDGAALYVVKAAEVQPKVWRMDLAGGRAEVWREIPVSDFAGVEAIRGIQIAPDGKSLAFGLLRTMSELHIARGFR